MSHAILFSPQGSQSIGMGRSLAESSLAARAVFAEADATLDWSISDVCWNGPAPLLDDTRQTQPCLVATGVAAFRAFMASDVEPPSFVAGHSVGEYAALVAAGVLELAAALRLVARRGQLMAEAAGASDAGGMVAVIGLGREAVAAVVAATAPASDLVLANDNAPGQVVISGRRSALVAAEPAMLAAGARRVIGLPVSGAFHSPLMKDVAADLAAVFEAEEWRDAAIPVMSNVTAEPLTDASQIRILLAEQVRSPVEWVRSVERMVLAGVDTMIECGSGAALAGMVRRIAPQVRTAAINDAASLAAAVDLLRQPVEASA